MCVLSLMRPPDSSRSLISHLRLLIRSSKLKAPRDTFIPSISNVICADLSLLIRSSKLVVPSALRTRFARTPVTLTLRMTSSLRNSGSHATYNCTLFSDANSCAPWCSDSRVFPKSSPSRGKSLSLISPSSVSVRCVFSCTRFTICGLKELGSTVKAITPRKMANSPSSPPTLSSPYLSNLFMPDPGRLKRKVERVMGIEPTSKAWEALVLPLNYTRKSGDSTMVFTLPTTTAHTAGKTRGLSLRI